MHNIIERWSSKCQRTKASRTAARHFYRPVSCPVKICALNQPQNWKEEPLATFSGNLFACADAAREEGPPWPLVKCPATWGKVWSGQMAAPQLAACFSFSTENPLQLPEGKLGKWLICFSISPTDERSRTTALKLHKKLIIVCPSKLTALPHEQGRGNAMREGVVRVLASIGIGFNIEVSLSVSGYSAGRSAGPTPSSGPVPAMVCLWQQ